MAAGATSKSDTKFWADVLRNIEAKRVIPVLGGELLNISENGQTIPLYRAVAERLLSNYGLSATALAGDETLRPGHELNDATCALSAAGERVNDLYGPIHDILADVLSKHKEVQEPLREIAAITDFTLLVTTTPDDVLVQTLNAVRFGGADLTHELKYAPKLACDDVPAILGPQYNAVFYLFGKSDVMRNYCIHDEDALEFCYNLPLEHPAGMYAQLRSCDLLLIGCNFYDWLSRFFIRISNQTRLSLDRQKKEFLVGQGTAGDRSLSTFLSRFSHDTSCYPGDARDFVAQLHRRWRERAASAGKLAPQYSQSAIVSPAPRSGGVFISYAHEDVVAARTVFTELEKISEVVWFDKTLLKPGDIWDSEIVRAVEHCDLFLPLISTATERRIGGAFFKREWNLAADRYKDFIGTKFIFPVVIDPEYTGDPGHYQGVPSVFRTLQYAHAPSGHVSSALRDEITNELRILRRTPKQI